MTPLVAVLTMWYTGPCFMTRLSPHLNSRRRPVVCKSCLRRALYREQAPRQQLLLIRHRHGQQHLHLHLHLQLEEHHLFLHPVSLRRPTLLVISVAAGYKTLRTKPACSARRRPALRGKLRLPPLRLTRNVRRSRRLTGHVCLPHMPQPPLRVCNVPVVEQLRMLRNFMSRTTRCSLLHTRMRGLVRIVPTAVQVLAV